MIYKIKTKDFRAGWKISTISLLVGLLFAVMTPLTDKAGGIFLGFSLISLLIGMLVCSVPNAIKRTKEERAKEIEVNPNMIMVHATIDNSFFNRVSSLIASTIYSFAVLFLLMGLMRVISIAL